jgi:methionyl-tRNA formyltransferase
MGRPGARRRPTHPRRHTRTRSLDHPVGRQPLGPVVPRPDVTDLAPGALRTGKQEVLVGTATHAVALGDVRPVGKRPMPAPDWARGAGRAVVETGRLGETR